MNVSSTPRRNEPLDMDKTYSAFPTSPSTVARPPRERPITIQRGSDGKEVVMMTAKVYREFQRTGRTALAAHELSDGEIEALRQAEPSPESERYNDECDPENEPGS